jgi:hypothetical protein
VDDDWVRRRREAVAGQAERLEREHAAETAQARELVAGFVAAARERSLPLEDLRARTASGGTTYRTGLRGWTLRRDGSAALGEDGEFYLLVVPGSLRARLSGVHLRPQDPPLVLGRGGRDGESVLLADLLARRLDEG